MNPNKYNVYEAYLHTFKNFILVLSYSPSFDIDFVIDDMKQTFNFKVVKLEGPSILNAESVFNYDKLNADVNKILEDNKEITSTNMTFGTGILVYGLNFPNDMLKFQVDVHLHFSLSVNLFLKLNKDQTIDNYNSLKTLLSTNTINKYFNVKSLKSTEMNDSVFDKIIDYVEFKVYGKNYKIYGTKQKNKPPPMPPPEPPKKITIEESEKNESDSIDIALTESEVILTNSTINLSSEPTTETDTDTNTETNTNTETD